MRFETSVTRLPAGQRLPMSSMIDVVFLLLVFFVMTFQITAPEGEFFVDGAETATVASDAITPNLPLRLRLTAKSNGTLLMIRLNGEVVANFAELQMRLIELQEQKALDGVTMTLDCDSWLKYEHVIDALDHVTAYRDDSGQLRALVRATRFASRR